VWQKIWGERRPSPHEFEHGPQYWSGMEELHVVDTDESVNERQLKGHEPP
jgi:hypothetical protein